MFHHSKDVYALLAACHGSEVFFLLFPLPFLFALYQVYRTPRCPGCLGFLAGHQVLQRGTRPHSILAEDEAGNVCTRNLLRVTEALAETASKEQQRGRE